MEEPVIELLNSFVNLARYLLSVTIVVASTLWVSVAIVLTGVDIVKANPLRWMSFAFWKCGIAIVGLFVIVGMYWG